MRNTLIIFVLIATAAMLYLLNRTHYAFEAEFYTALQNFTYVSDEPGNETYTAFTSIENAFYGDCEDFAFTLQNQIGGEVWAVTHTENQHHAVLIVDGIVYDNFFKIPTPIHKYPGSKLYPIFFRGKYIDNS